MAQHCGIVCQTHLELHQPYNLLFLHTDKCKDLNFRLTIYQHRQLCVNVCILDIFYAFLFHPTFIFCIFFNTFLRLFKTKTPGKYVMHEKRSKGITNLNLQTKSSFMNSPTNIKLGNLIWYLHKMYRTC